MTFLTFFAETAIHIGIGQERGPVDLPVHRERHTGLPFLPGHGLKGALRAHAEARAAAETDETKKKAAYEKVATVFGPNAGEDLSQGALIVYDALPLAVPFRSLQTVFLWATSPLLLRRFATRTGTAVRFEEPDEGQFVPFQPSEQERPRGRQAARVPDLIVVEDLDFTCRQGAHHALDLASLAPPGVTARVAAERVIVLADTDFGYLVRQCLPVAARVQLTAGKTTGKWIDPVDGKPAEGNLWTEEMLPPDTVLYAPVAQVAWNGKGADALEYLGELLGTTPAIQVGGNETVGLGWCWLSLRGAGGGQA